MPSTFALDAVKHLTELNSALVRRKLKAVTPYLSEAWDLSLREADIYNKYPYIVSGLRQGFIINLPSISTTQAPPNQQSVTEFAKEFSRIVEHEIAKQR